MKKVEAWQTDDGKLFMQEDNARDHEIQRRIRQGLQYWATKYFTPTSDPLAANDEINRVWRSVSKGWRELRDILNKAECS